MALTQIKAAALTADLIDETKLADNSIDSEHYNDGSIDTAHIADDQITNAKVNSSAAIAGSKISPDFGSQNVVSTGTSNALGTTTIKGGSNAAARLLLQNTTSVRTNYIGLSGDDDRIVIAADDANQGSNSTIDFKVDGSERMRIDSSGNVGIGTTSPSGKLNLATGASAACELRLTSNNTGSGSGDRGRLSVYSSRNDGTAFEAGKIEIDRESGTEDKARIQLFTNGGSGNTERMRIDSSGMVIIGATSYGGGGTAPAFYVSNTGGRQVKIHNTNSGTSSLQITNAATGQGDDNGMMYATLGTGEGWICNAESAAIRFGTGASGLERLRILDGGGITFNGDTATANGLDDYEEGTWTPTGEWDTLVATYTKIGRVVHAAFQVRVNSFTSNAMSIGGLPFNCANSEASRNGIYWGWNEWDSTDSNKGQLTGNITPGGNSLGLYKMDGSGNEAQYNELGNDKFLKGVICYQTA